MLLKEVIKIKNELRKLRAGRTQAELANIFGVSQQVWSSWETGKCLPSLTVIGQMEKLFNVNRSVIFPRDFLICPYD